MNSHFEGCTCYVCMSSRQGAIQWSPFYRQPGVPDQGLGNAGVGEAMRIDQAKREAYQEAQMNYDEIVAELNSVMFGLMQTSDVEAALQSLEELSRRVYGWLR